MFARSVERASITERKSTRTISTAGSTATLSSYTCTVTSRYTAIRRVRLPHPPAGSLEPDAVKVARPVLRGEGGREAPDLPDYYAPADARGMRWNDPAINVSWPLAVTVISERDAQYPDFLT